MQKSPLPRKRSPAKSICIYLQTYHPAQLERYISLYLEDNNEHSFLIRVESLINLGIRWLLMCDNYMHLKGSNEIDSLKKNLMKSALALAHEKKSKI